MVTAPAYMAVPEPAELVSLLRSSTNPAQQILALRALKSLCIGHVEAKENLIRHGILECLPLVIANASRTKGKQRSHETNGAHNSGLGFGWEKEDDVRSQAIALVGSFANGGPAFVPPLIASSVIPELVACTSLSLVPPKVVLSALKALVAIAETSKYTNPSEEPFYKSAACEAIYSRPAIRSFADILSQKQNSSIARVQIVLVARLITETCFTEDHRKALLSHGVADLLVGRLVSYKIGHDANQNFGGPRNGPSPRLGERDILWLLKAVGAIVAESKYRIARILLSPALDVADALHDQTQTTRENTSRRNWNATDTYPSPANAKSETLVEHDGSPTGVGSFKGPPAFPELSSKSIAAQASGSPVRQDGSLLGAENEVAESPMTLWLMRMVRSAGPASRVESSRLLVRIATAGFLHTHRQRFLTQSVVPFLISVVDEAISSRPSPHGPQGFHDDQDGSAPAALMALSSLLDAWPSDLQRVAVEAGLLKKTYQLLKATFEPLPLHSPPWNPDGEPNEGTTDMPDSWKLGPRGLRGDFVRALACRAGSLHLIASVAGKDEKYRKQLVDLGVINLLIPSLKPFDEFYITGFIYNKIVALQKAHVVESLGNSHEVLIAACRATRNMSRSVALIRTSLIDSGIVKPALALLKIPNVEVTKAATEVVCNIALEFSPLRKFIDADAVRTLCAHAHSANSALRLVSLWALKHLVHLAPRETKSLCYEELGTGWLMRTINGVSHGGEIDESMDLTEDQAKSTNGDVHESHDDIFDEIALRLQNNIDSTSSHRARTQLARLNENRVELERINEYEQHDIAVQVHRDELQIQLQGLDFIRNLTQGPDATVMVSMIFDTIGEKFLFENILKQLREGVPRNSEEQTPECRSMVCSTVCICVHIAAGNQRHRQMLLAQAEIIDCLLLLLDSQDANVRSAILVMVSNLVWVDQDVEQAGAAARASELRAKGFCARIKDLEEDKVPDVRHRAEAASKQIEMVTAPSPLAAPSRSR